MPPLPFTLRQLQYFDYVASSGSLAAAAAQCAVSASALGLAIDELEDRLALQLFIRRKGTGVTLTPAGSSLLSRARGVLSGAEALAVDATEVAVGLNGRFPIGCFLTLAPFFLPGLMADFRRAHPELEIEIEEAAARELNEMMVQGRIDVALMYSTDVPPFFEFEPVHEYRPYLMVASDHPLSRRRAVRLSDVADEPMILLDVHPTWHNTEQIFASLGLTPRIGYATTNFELARCLAARGLGYAILFQRPAQDITYDGHRVAVLDLLDNIPRTEAGLVRPAGAPRTARYQALLDYLTAAVA